MEHLEANAHTLSKQRALEVLDIARFAPSVHNTQPWKVSLSDCCMEVSIDKSNILSSGDPTGRETMISLGIFVEAILIAAKSLGLAVKKIHHTKDVVRIEFKGIGPISQDSLAQVRALKGRASDRSIYKPLDLDARSTQKIRTAWRSNNAKIWVIDNREFIEKLADFTSKGIRLALSNPDFRRELSDCLILPWSRKKRGIAVESLYLPYLLGVSQPLMLRYGLNLGREAELEKQRWLSASAVVLITSDGDLHSDWLESGQVYMQASLAIQRLGLSQATSAAAVEASTFHEDIEAMLGTKQRLQTAMRIGKGSRKQQFSPRISADELIA